MEAFRQYCKDNDPGICAAVSDPKGNRELHAEDPNQKHKDFYARVVDRKKDGIVIRGCKLHISHSIFSNELIVLPSRNHNETGKDYAVSCTANCDTEGVKFIGTDSAIAAGGGRPMIIFDYVYINCAKFWFADNWHQAIKFLQDITGGIAGTMPSFQDYENPQTKGYIDKYLGGAADLPTEERLKVLQAIKRIASAFGGVLTIHAEGSLASQRMPLYQQADWDLFKAAARHTLKIPTDHPAFKEMSMDVAWEMKE